MIPDIGVSDPGSHVQEVPSCTTHASLSSPGHILTSPIAGALPTLPFNVLKILFDSTPLTTDDGVLLRRMTLDIGAIHLVLACLSVLSHHAPRTPIPGFHQEVRLFHILGNHHNFNFWTPVCRQND